MSNDNSRDALSDAPIPQKNNPAEVVRNASAVDAVLWLVAIVLLIAATMVNLFLPQYWQPASNIWVRIAAIATCIIVALGLLYATHQGKGFIRLLKDSRIELRRRITWPTKQETITTSWQVLVVVVITSIVLWCFDYSLGWLIKLIIG